MDADKRTWIYAGLALVAGVGLVSIMAKKSEEAPSPGIAPKKTGPILTPKGVLVGGDRVFLFGDSLAQGLTKPLEQLASDMGVKFFGDGRTSTIINQWNSQPWLANDLSLAPPKFILVSLGTNDMKLFDANTEKSALNNLITKMKATKATIVWILPPTMPFPDNGILKMIMATGLPVFHSEALSIPRGSDKIHPTVAGYAGWAGAIWAFLKRGV